MAPSPNRMSRLAKPDDLQQLLKVSERYYAGRNQVMERSKSLYYQEYDGIVDVPSSVKMFKSSRPTTVVDDLRDQINLEDVQIDAAPNGTSKEAERRASLQGVWAKHLINATNENNMAPPFSQAKHDLPLMGGAVIKWLINPDVLKEPEQKRGESKENFKERKDAWALHLKYVDPFIVKPLDPTTVYPNPGSGELKYIIEVQERKVMSMWENYPEWTDPKAALKSMQKQQRDNPLRPVKWVEFWSWIWEGDEWQGWYIVEADGQRIIEAPNLYRHVPYSFRYSGLGRTDADADPGKLAVSILNLIEGELISEIELKTAMTALWQYHVFPRLKAKGIDAKEVAKRFNVAAGGIIEIPIGAGQDVEYLTVPAPNIAMLDYIARVEQAIDRRVNPALGGTRTADAGIHQALQIGQAIKSIETMKLAVNGMATDFIRGAAQIMQNPIFDITMAVGGGSEGEPSRMISRKDFAQAHLTARFEAVDPTENDRNMLSLLSVKRDPKTLSRQTFREHALASLIDDNEEEEARILAEAILDQMVDSGMITQLVMQDLQLAQEEEALDGTAAASAQATSALMSEAATSVAGRENIIEEIAGAGATGASRTAAAGGFTQAGV